MCLLFPPLYANPCVETKKKLYFSLLQGKGVLVTYWLKGEIVDPNVPRHPLIKTQTQSTESGSLSHLTPFRNRLDQSSRSSSRRGSGIFQHKIPDIAKLEKDAQPLLQNLSIQRQQSDPTEPFTNGINDNEEELDKLSVTNSISLNVNSLNHNSVNQGQPRVKLKDHNLVVNHKSNKIGNNNWISKLPTASSFDNGTKKGSERLKDYSSVPLLSKTDTPNDSIV